MHRPRVDITNDFNSLFTSAFSVRFLPAYWLTISPELGTIGIESTPTRGLISSGTVSTFGLPLSQVFGQSKLNPNNFKNNCVSVSIARLLSYRDVDDLWADTYRYPLPDHPLDYTAIIDLIQRTGWHFKWECYRLKPGKPIWKSLDPYDSLNLIDGALAALLYSRPDGTGHCVVWGDMVSSHVPICFQRHDEGTDLTHDILIHTDMVYLLRLKCPPSTEVHRRWLDRMVRRKLERSAERRNWRVEYRIFMDIQKDTREDCWGGSFESFCRSLKSTGEVVQRGPLLVLARDKAPLNAQERVVQKPTFSPKARL